MGNLTGNIFKRPGDVTYTGTAELTVGGLAEGTEFTAAPISDVIDAMIKQEKYPTLTNPSLTFTASVTGFREIGDTVTVDFLATFSRGSINPQYTADSPHRSGLPNEYQYTGTGLVNEATTSLTDAQTVIDFEVTSGANSWQARVAYDEGVQPKSSYDNDYEAPLAAGTTAYVTRTITGVYPFFATTSAIGTMTKQTLVAHGATVTTNMVAESGGDKQSVEFPDAWGAITQLEQYNTLSGAWDVIDLASFTTSAISKTIQGNAVDYTKYTHNGDAIGGRNLRWRI